MFIVCGIRLWLKNFQKDEFWIFYIYGRFTIVKITLYTGLGHARTSGFIYTLVTNLKDQQNSVYKNVYYVNCVIGRGITKFYCILCKYICDKSVKVDLVDFKLDISKNKYSFQDASKEAYRDVKNSR